MRKSKNERIDSLMKIIKINPTSNYLPIYKNIYRLKHEKRNKVLFIDAFSVSLMLGNPISV